VCERERERERERKIEREREKVVSEERTQVFYQSLGTKEGEKSIYKFDKGGESQTRDLDQV